MSDDPAEELPPLNPLFRFVIFVSGAFLLTVLIMLASVFSDGKSPVFGWFNRNAVTVLGVEVVLIIACSIAAMAFDQKSTQGEEQESSPADPGDGSIENPASGASE